MVFLLLHLSFLFEFLLLHTVSPFLDTTLLTLSFYTLVCCLSMPPRRESLASVKKSLVREQQSRTDRRVRELLQQRQRLQGIEVLDDSEEENRLIGRRARGLRVQASQTESSPSSFCCGMFVGVFVVLTLLCCLLILIANDRQRMAR